MDQESSDNVAEGIMAPPALIPERSAGDGPRRRAKKIVRQGSRDNAVVAGPIPQHRSWKNSRRPRNGHGRGLPKKGKQENKI